MSWIGKIVGGAIGGMMGGPMGLAIGAGLGHAYDNQNDPIGGPAGLLGRGRQALGVRCSYEDDGLGLLVLLGFPATVRAGATAVAILHDAAGDSVRAPAPWADSNGEFAVVTDVTAAETLFYVPYAALDYRVGGIASLQVATLLAASGEQGSTVIGLDSLAIALPSPALRPAGGRIAVLQPLIDLGMAVARADGKVEREEIRLLKEFFRGSFDVAGEELTHLRDAIKAADTSDVPGSVQAVFRRLPGLTAGDLLAFLAAVARSDGRVDAAEVAVIREVAQALGASVRETAAALADLDLSAQDAPHTVLGVSRDASAAEIKTAYRDRMKAYHPDRVATLPAEFQDLAHRKSQEIRAAFDALSP